MLEPSDRTARVKFKQTVFVTSDVSRCFHKKYFRAQALIDIFKVPKNLLRDKGVRKDLRIFFEFLFRVRLKVVQ
ncbi:hypothetical protein LEP1GSC068_1469 [Leptospira sp. Fiocruz LV3954]|nr:hypothetical protein LEP1GSC068_1469 [Leptospira sp. Fiocruz LV3954]EMI63821.1 hypothetical protein LEP1GSC076_3080 [Leptospira sp. Fiocruz LV4135]